MNMQTCNRKYVEYRDVPDIQMYRSWHLLIEALCIALCVGSVYSSNYETVLLPYR